MSSSQPEERRSPQGRSPAHRLAQGLDLCQPLLAACAPQLRLYPKLDASASAVFDVDAVAVANRLVTAVAQRYALPAPVFVWPPPEDPNALEAALCAYCELGVEDWRALVSDPHALAEVAALPDFGQEERRLVEVDGHPPVITYSAGPAGPAGPATRGCPRRASSPSSAWIWWARAPGSTCSLGPLASIRATASSRSCPCGSTCLAS
ncbi:MAG TPA: hypothetical protein PKU97_08100 [Kofleriaceae bacterium]|nr:hypothetical protein [Kofleriaceae bacterium]